MFIVRFVLKLIIAVTMVVLGFLVLTTIAVGFLPTTAGILLALEFKWLTSLSRK